MRAVIVTTPGGPEALTLAELPDPEPGPGEVVVRVAATAVNRADLLQRKGFYPPPPGAPDTIGLECSGVISALGPGVLGWAVGDEVCCLLAGGGYAEQVVVPVGQVMPVPEGVDLVTAGSLPEVACTVWSNVFRTAGLQPGERLLVHGGAGGIGTFAIQLAKAMGAEVVATAGSPEKLALCRSLGADTVVDYSTEDFVAVVKGLGGADVILDNMGGAYLSRNVDALAPHGRLAIIGMQGGVKGELDINTLLGKWGTITAATLRSRTTAEKAAICAEVAKHVWPLVTSGAVRTMVHTTLPLEAAGEAHRRMEAGEHTGKILLTMERLARVQP